MGAQVRFSRSRAAGAVVLAFVLTIPAAAQSGHTGSLDSITIDNFARVNDQYYRGAQPQGHSYADLAGLGIRTVIDLQEYGDVTEPDAVEKAGMRYVRIPMNTRINPTPEQLAQFLQIVNDPASQPIYVHCAGGRHRTGVMTAVYRMTADSWTPDQAFREMKKYRFGADFLHPEFKKFVYAYQAPALAAPPAIAGPATAVAETAAAN